MPPSIKKDADARAVYLHALFLEVEKAIQRGEQARQALVGARRRRRARFFRNSRLSFAHLKRLFYRWRKHRTAEGLRRRYKPGVQPRSTVFVDAFLRRLGDDAGLSARDLFRQFEREWKSGQPVPGFGTWRHWCISRGERARKAAPRLPVTYWTLSTYVRTTKPHEYRRLHRNLARAKAALAKFIDGRREALLTRRRQIDATAHFPVRLRSKPNV